MKQHRSGSPRPTLDIRIGASTRLPRGYDARGRGPSPHALMLRRWVRFGAREDDSTTYGGCPLPTTLWQTVAGALKQDPQLLSRRADVAARALRALASEDDDTRAFWDAPHRAALIDLLRRLDRAGVLRRLLRPGVPVPHLLLYRSRGRRYPRMFLVDVVMPRGRVDAARRSTLQFVRVPGVSAGIVRLRDRGGLDEGWLTRQEREELDALVELSVDEHMEGWARSLLIAVDGEIRKLTEEEVQLIAHPPAEAPAPRRSARR